MIELPLQAIVLSMHFIKVPFRLPIDALAPHSPALPFPRLDSYRIERPARRIPLPTPRPHEHRRTTKECCHRSDGIAVPRIGANQCDRHNRRILHARATAGEFEKVGETLIFRVRNALRALKQKETTTAGVSGARDAVQSHFRESPRSDSRAR